MLLWSFTEHWEGDYKGDILPITQLLPNLNWKYQLKNARNL